MPACRLGLLIAVLASVPLASQASPAGCSMNVGQSVALESDATDPDVFVWDSRARLLAYVAGGWDSARDVMDHTLLASPGTTAKIVQCVPGVAHPKYSAGAVDALGVKVLRGSYRGKYGWVVATDARAIAFPRASR